MKRFLPVFAFASLSLAFAHEASARSYTMTSIYRPGSTFTDGVSLNDKGHVVGYYGTNESIDIVTDDGVYSASIVRGFVSEGKKITDFSIPGAEKTYLLGINNRGDLIGNYRFPREDAEHAFLYRSGKLTSLDYPEAKYNGVVDINNSGQVLGYYSLDGETSQPYLYESGKFTPLEAQFPGAANAGFTGLNDKGDLVGGYTLTDYFGYNGFIYSDGKFIEVDHPVDAPAFLSDINNSGQVIGMYQNPDDANPIGFLYEDGEFYELPIISDDQGFSSINNNGQITGYYRGTWPDYGETDLAFLLTPKKAVAAPEPSTVLLLGTALAGILVSSRFKRHAI